MEAPRFSRAKKLAMNEVMISDESWQKVLWETIPVCLDCHHPIQ